MGGCGWDKFGSGYDLVEAVVKTYSGSIIVINFLPSWTTASFWRRTVCSIESVPPFSLIVDARCLWPDRWQASSPLLPNVTFAVIELERLLWWGRWQPNSRIDFLARVSSRKFRSKESFANACPVVLFATLHCLWGGGGRRCNRLLESRLVFKNRQWWNRICVCGLKFRI